MFALMITNSPLHCTVSFTGLARREQKTFSLRLRRAQYRTARTLEQFNFERLPLLPPDRSAETGTVDLLAR